MAEALRVVIVCPYSLARPGGVQGQCAGLGRALRRQGHEVLVVAPGEAPPAGAGGLVSVSARTVGISANGSVAPLSLSPLAARRALRTAADWGPDVVHLHEPLAPVVGYGVLLAARWPLVGTFHRAGHSRAYRVAGPVARWGRSRLDVCCAVSDEAARTAEAQLGGTYEVVFNGIDLGRFEHAVRAPSDVPAVLFLGRHELRKGLGVLLEAWEHVSRPAVLWVAGDGPETAALRSRHPESDRVRWLGVLSDEDVASRLAGAAALCAPSLGGESFGMVLLEAMAAGTPVVASDIAGYRAAAGGHARLVPAADPVALARALDGLLAEPPGAEERTAAAAHAARWSMDALASRYVEIYARAVARRGRGNVAGR